MRNYKSIIDYIEYHKVNAIEDLDTGYIYNLDYCTHEIFSMNFILGNGIKEYFIRLPNSIEIWYDEPCLYT